MAPRAKATNSSSKSKGLIEKEDIFPTIVHSNPVTPLQKSLLNSPFNPNLEETRDPQDAHGLEEAIDPQLMQSKAINPSVAPDFNHPFTLEVDPTLALDKNFPGSVPGSYSINLTNQYDSSSDFAEYIPNPNECNSFPLDNGGAPSSFRLGNTNDKVESQKSSTKVPFVDPMHPHAHLKHVAVFCCQSPTCVQECKVDYKYATRQFTLHYSRQSIEEPLYSGRKRVVPQTDNPDHRIPMLLLSGARVYRVEKLGENPVVRLFVGDIINRKKKYWEVLPGGAVEQLGWIQELRDTAAPTDRCSAWKCTTHGDIWKVSILDHLFDNGAENTGTLGTDYDSGYASSSGHMGSSSRKGSSTYGDNNATFNTSPITPIKYSVGKNNAILKMSPLTPTNYSVGENNVALKMSPVTPTNYSFDGYNMLFNASSTTTTSHSSGDQHGPATTISNVKPRRNRNRNRSHGANKMSSSGNNNSLEQIEEDLEDFEISGDVTELLEFNDYASTSGCDFMQPQAQMWDDDLLNEVNTFIADGINFGESVEHTIEHDFDAI
ncbi:uncharacterized protein EAE98_007754 [Botrytis deweyae]|uniref:Uncharacterized protein n=1 Tax=Botrytis deweyae TaxID=2478750 RepID=A0ABQ7IFX9_9HELO|nr:uncharacterized protein EAE98_007754 [Botrytis deweyae]KAF7923049.1 hypothetical protein EAE98_007754 [Botrytis deweyae]